MSVSVPGNICAMRNDISPERRPAKRKREYAYAAVHAIITPTTVVAAETIALLSTQRANGWSFSTDTKFRVETSAGHGVIARSRSTAVGFDGRLTIARLCLPENATVITQRIG